VNQLVASLFDRGVTLFGAVPSLLLISIVLGALLALVFGMISPQARVRAVKNRIAATTLEAILYRHDTRVSLAAQGRLFGYAGWYFLLAVPPILVLIVPTVFLMGHMNELFGYRLPTSGERMLVEARASSIPKVELQSGGSFTATPTLHIPSENALVWRIDRTSSAEPTLRIGDVEFDLQGPRLAPVVTSSWWERLLYPATAAPKLPASVDEINFGFPAQTYRFVGHDFSWITIFLILSLVSGYVTARIKGIAI